MAGYGAIGGLDYNDPYLKAALASYNINCKGADIAQNDATTVSNPYAAYAAAAASSDVPQLSGTPQTVAEESGIDTGMVVGGALTLAAAAGACIIGHNAGKGKGIIQGWKNIIKGLGGASKKAAGATQLTAINTKNGLRYLVPGKRTDVAKSAADIQKLITENNLNVSAERLELNAESVISGFNFKGNKVVIKDGVITDIINSKKSSILKVLEEAEEGTAKNKLYNDILKAQSEFAKGAEADKDFLNGIIDIKYTNKSGDEIYEMLLKRYGTTPAQTDIKGLSTLERFKFDAPEVQHLVCSEAEKALIMPEFIKNRKLTDGMTLGEYSLKINGTTCYFNGKDLVAIEGASGKCPAGSAGYENWLNEVKSSRLFGTNKTTNQDLVNKEIARIFEKREYIPLEAVVKAA